MPYPTIEAAPAAWKTHQGASLTLDQINKLASIYDEIKKRGTVDEPAAVAWATWEKIYRKEGDAWVKIDKKEMSDDNDDNVENNIIKDVEIFSAGNWKGFNFTQEDIENIVDNFGVVKLAVPLKLGHKPDQKMAKREGYPASGWITNLRHVGKKLIADITHIPKKIFELIQKKAYTRFSSEIWMNYDYKGNVYKNVLVGVALLGEEVPAVNTLQDMLNLYAVGTYSEDWPEGQVIKIHETEIKGKEEHDMDLEKQLNETKAELVKLTEKESATQKENEALKIQLSDQQKKTNKEKIYSIVDKGIAEFKFTPSSRELLVALALKADGHIENCYTFTETKDDGNEKEVSIKFSDSSELVQKLADALPQQLSTNEQSKGEQQQKRSDNVTIGKTTYFTDEEQNAAVEKIAKEQNVSFAEAANIYIEQQSAIAREKEVE